MTLLWGRRWSGVWVGREEVGGSKTAVVGLIEFGDGLERDWNGLGLEVESAPW